MIDLSAERPLANHSKDDMLVGKGKIENKRFSLCYALNETESKRDPDNKWYVSHQD